MPSQCQRQKPPAAAAAVITPTTMTTPMLPVTILQAAAQKSVIPSAA